MQFGKIMLKIARINERRPYANWEIRIYANSFNKIKIHTNIEAAKKEKKDCLDDLKRQSEWKYVSLRKEWKLDF